MDTIYNYNNYEIILKKCVDSVYIQFLDKQLFKLYANTYIDVDVIKITMGNLDMFYKMMTTVFESLSNNDDKATIEIFPSMKNLKLSIHHKFYLEFNFELQLNLIEEQSLNAKDMCIKKLENSLNEINKEYLQLEQSLDELNQIVIAYSKTKHHLLKIPSKEIPLDINILDFTLYDDYEFFNESTVLLAFNKLTNLKKIIFGKGYYEILGTNCINIPSVYEIVIICYHQVNDKYMNDRNFNFLIFNSFENLSKITLIDPCYKSNIKLEGIQNYIDNTYTNPVYSNCVIMRIFMRCLEIKKITYIIINVKSETDIDSIIKTYNRIHDLKIEIIN